MVSVDAAVVSPVGLAVLGLASAVVPTVAEPDEFADGPPELDEPAAIVTAPLPLPEMLIALGVSLTGAVVLGALPPASVWPCAEPAVPVGAWPAPAIPAAEACWAVWPSSATEVCCASPMVENTESRWIVAT